MNRRLLMAAAALAVLMAGCRTAPIYNVKDAPITVTSGQPTLRSVEQAIVKAGTGLGWAMKVDQPGHITGTLNLRTHTAVVSIPYTASSFSILYKDSTNLEQKDDTIHRNYNGWVQNLEQAIRRHLAS